MPIFVTFRSACACDKPPAWERGSSYPQCSACSALFQKSSEDEPSVDHAALVALHSKLVEGFEPDDSLAGLQALAADGDADAAILFAVDMAERMFAGLLATAIGLEP